MTVGERKGVWLGPHVVVLAVRQLDPRHACFVAALADESEQRGGIGLAALERLVRREEDRLIARRTLYSTCHLAA